jgi:hypothetical protein
MYDSAVCVALSFTFWKNLTNFREIFEWAVASFNFIKRGKEETHVLHKLGLWSVEGCVVS